MESKGRLVVGVLILCYLLSIADPTGRDPPCKSLLLNYLSRRKKGFLFFLATAQPMRDTHSLANEKPWHFQLPVYTNVFFVIITPPNSHPSSTKEDSSPLFGRIVCGFGMGCLSQVGILCCSWINPFFAGEITGRFILRLTQAWDRYFHSTRAGIKAIMVSLVPSRSKFCTLQSLRIILCGLMLCWLSPWRLAWSCL